jgi:N-methylhydantoinase B
MTPHMAAHALDPITLEVLRHRLMMINDEQGRVASQLSGSPVVYEAKDFNSALLTASGESLFIGVYMTRLSLCLSAAVKTTIDQFGASMGFREGDAFVTNDPWAGAAHMNDILMFAPIFHEGCLICWTGLAMHEIDVGGPNPGSFTVGAPDVFGEAPLIPPIRLIEGGVLREDLEALLVRNSRTSQINGLNIRARIAAINRTRQRIAEIIGEYGAPAIIEAQAAILRLAQTSFARRLKSLPDGRWISEGFLDHDGNQNTLYRLRVELTKRGDRLKFDFTGTDKQARGAINCTRVGLESGVFSAVLPLLCYDMPWSPGGIGALVDIVSEEGTINNAMHPAAVSMATISGIFATGHIAYGALAKMIACSPLRDEIQANWAPAWQGAAMAGLWRDGRRFTTVFLDNTGGSGARADRDGLDAGGLPGSPAMAIGNVEVYEKENPVLYVFRKYAPDTGGSGLQRGGVGTQSLVVPHKNAGAIDMTVLTHGASQPESQGLFGGYPSSVQIRLLLRNARIGALFADGVIPDSIEAMREGTVESLAAKQRLSLEPDDAVLILCAGGGGYGDPIDRAPGKVLHDIREGLVSPAIARAIYGVVVGDSGAKLEVDQSLTKAARQDIRQRRLAQSAPVRYHRVAPSRPRNTTETERIGAAVKVVDDGSRRVLICVECDTPLAEHDEDPKAGALWRETEITDASPWNRYGLVDEIVLREFCCPSCAHLIGVQVAKKSDALLFDTFLTSARHE